MLPPKLWRWGLEEFASFKDVGDAASGGATDQNDAATVAAVEQPIRELSLNRYSDALVVLSGKPNSVMADPELVLSELPSNLKALLL